jgi:hypothetical protein
MPGERPKFDSRPSHRQPHEPAERPQPERGAPPCGAQRHDEELRRSHEGAAERAEHCGDPATQGTQSAGDPPARPLCRRTQPAKRPGEHAGGSLSHHEDPAPWSSKHARQRLTGGDDKHEDGTHHHRAGASSKTPQHLHEVPGEDERDERQPEQNLQTRRRATRPALSPTRVVEDIGAAVGHGRHDRITGLDRPAIDRRPC